MTTYKTKTTGEVPWDRRPGTHPSLGFNKHALTDRVLVIRVSLSPICNGRTVALNCHMTPLSHLLRGTVGCFALKLHTCIGEGGQEVFKVLHASLGHFYLQCF